jgi:hypothetical protein
VIRKLFALDHNFPPPILAALEKYIPEATLVPLSDIDARMPLLEDWQLLVALERHDKKWHGLITNDTDFATGPRELAALIQTRLAVVVVEAAGHDAIKATGMLFAHLPGICRRVTPGTPQLWRLRVADRPAVAPMDALRDVAARRHKDFDTVKKENWLTEDELQADDLASVKAPA